MIENSVTELDTVWEMGWCEKRNQDDETRLPTSMAILTLRATFSKEQRVARTYHKTTLYVFFKNN